MSAHSFLNGFSNGLMFGMLTSTPLYGAYGNSFCSPCISPFYNPCTNPFYSYPVSTFMMPTFYSTPYYSPISYGYGVMPSLFSYQLPYYGSYNYAPFGLSNFNYGYSNFQYQMPSFTFNIPTVSSETQNNYSTPPSNVSKTVSNSASKTTSASSPSSTSSTSVGTYSGSSSDVTKLYTGSVDALNRKLANKGVLRGKGAKFMEMQEKYGISASFLVAICLHESNGGTSKQATDSRNLHNVAGITCNGGKDFRKFASVDDCIEHLAKMLRNNYLNKGLTTISQIHLKYCPPVGDKKDKTGENSVWGRRVAEYKSELDSAVA